MGEKAVVLLSGGLDSCTCMAVADAAGHELYPVSFDYHQRHIRELLCAKKIAVHYHAAEHLIIETNMNAVGGSALTIRLMCRKVMRSGQTFPRPMCLRATSYF